MICNRVTACAAEYLHQLSGEYHFELVMSAVATVGAERLSVYVAVIDPGNCPFMPKVLVPSRLKVFFKACCAEIRCRQFGARIAQESRRRLPWKTVGQIQPFDNLRIGAR